MREPSSADIQQEKEMCLAILKIIHGTHPPPALHALSAVMAIVIAKTHSEERKRLAVAKACHNLVLSLAIEGRQ